MQPIEAATVPLRAAPSLHDTGVEEPSDAYTVMDLKAERFNGALPNNFKTTTTLFDYGYMGTRHLQQLANLATEQEAVLKPYAFELAEALGASMSDIQTHLRNMLRTHSAEWALFIAAQGEQSFLKLWTKGGRHD